VAARLDQPLYAPRTGRSGTYVVWDRERAQPQVWQTMLLKVSLRARDLGRPVWFATTERLPVLPANYTLEAEFPDALAPFEAFWLYRVDPIP
jgi:hypothetical protein